MRVFLIYSNQSRELVPAPPVGLSYVASAAEAAGHEVHLLDLAFSADLLGDLAAAVTAFAPDVVGLSVRNIDNVISQRFDSPLAFLRQQVETLRRHARGADGQPVPLVLGGPAISILAERALPLLGADFAVTGEGETAFPALLDALATGAPVAAIPGVCYWENGEPRRATPCRQAGFAASGLENWVDWTPYQAAGGTWPIQTKRGCPMKCVYCAYPLVEGQRFRRRSAGEVVDEIERVMRTVRPRTFEFVDSTFNLPAAHSIEICEEILRRGIRANFTAMGVNPLDVPPELFPVMKRAGFNSVMITPEAGCDSMLANLGKGFTMGHIETCLERVRDSGLKSMWFFMLGGPGETMATCEESIAFAEQRLTGRRFVSVFFTGVRILPGTVLAQKLVGRGEYPPDADFADGEFYFSPLIDEQQVLDRIHLAVTRNPSIVQAAEGGATGAQTLLYGTLRRLGVAPPYWRFLPELLSFPPLRHLRSKYPSVVARPDGLVPCEA
jgi:radical SAM superfamily enzyme YgiQ (UPF0313 family)